MKRDNVIEEIGEKDIMQLQQILKNVFNSNTSYEKMQNSYKMSRKNKNVYILGYYINDNLVGTVTLNILTLPSGKEAAIGALATKEEYRRLGIGSKLMNKAEEIARSYEDIKRIWLFSGVDKNSAHELYRKLGYDENTNKAFVKQI